MEGGSNNSIFLLRNHGNEKEITKIFSTAELKEQSSQNPIYNEISTTEGNFLKK